MVAKSFDGAKGAARLHAYWTVGEGGAKIAWGSPDDFTRCVTHLSKYVPPNEAKGMCARMHHQMTGMWPGDKRNV